MPRPTEEEILAFIEKVDEIRDIHEILPGNDPEWPQKAIIEAFCRQFFPEPDQQ